MKNHILMILVTVFVSTLAIYADDFGSGAYEFEIEFALMGNAGNAADIGGYGDVAYNYKIGRYEVTVEQFSKARNQDNRISNANENYWEAELGEWAPAVNVSWQEAAKFCNWLTSGDAHAGAYAVSGGDVISVDRAAAVTAYGLVYVIPTEDEWYKAAYHTGSGYSAYANGTSTIPVKGPDGANYEYYYPYPGKPWVAWQGGGEHNATHNMNGNVWEICEDGADLLIRGGAFDEPPRDRKDGADHFFQAIEIGFRVAAISSVMVGEDDFDDSSFNSLKWNAVWSSPHADLVESGGRLNHTNNPAYGGTYESWHWSADTLSYTQSWALVMDVSSSINPASLSSSQSVELGIGVEIGDYSFVLEHRTDDVDFDFITKAGDIPSDSVVFASWQYSFINQATLIVSFDADTEELSTAYRVGYDITALTNLSTSGWGMSDSSEFTPFIQVDNSSVGVSLGELTGDNFHLLIGEQLNFSRTVESIGITKTALFEQTGSATVLPDSASFKAWVDGENLTAYYPSAPININGSDLAFNGNKHWLEQDFGSVASMNSAFANGSYQLNLAGTNVTLELSPESYPATPLCVSTAGSWVGGRLQVSSAEAANGFSLSANDGDTANGYLSIGLFSADESVELEAYKTYPTASLITLAVPGGELVEGEAYTVEVEFDHNVDYADAGYIDSGAWANALFSSRTTFEIEVVNHFVTIPLDWKTLHFPGGYPGDTVDSDNDTLDNRSEFIAGTSPTSGESVFAATNAVHTPQGFVFSWTPVEGRVYTVEWTESLTNSFQTLEPGITHPQNSYTDIVHTAEDGGFYNLKVELGN